MWATSLILKLTEMVLGNVGRFFVAKFLFLAIAHKAALPLRPCVIKSDTVCLEDAETDVLQLWQLVAGSLKRR